MNVQLVLNFSVGFGDNWSLRRLRWGAESNRWKSVAECGVAFILYALPTLGDSKDNTFEWVIQPTI